VSDAGTREGRLVDLVDTTGVLIIDVELPSHAALAQVSLDGEIFEARAYALDQTTALLVSPRLRECGSDGDHVTLTLKALRSVGRTTHALRTRLAALMALPEESLDAWDERQVRHALLYVLEATDGSLRDARLVALEAALGAHTTL
jgi:hypothetical protein